MRAELDSILSPNFDASCTKLREDPYLLNQMPYTTGVLKESLRLYPPASTLRTGHAG
jgi:cytochrome P450